MVAIMVSKYTEYDFRLVRYIDSELLATILLTMSLDFSCHFFSVNLNYGAPLQF